MPILAQFDHAVLKNDTRHPFVVQCEQFKTAKLVLDRLQNNPNVEVLFDHEVIDVAQSADAASVQVRGVTGDVLTFRPELKIIEGRMARPGSDECVIGRAIRGRFRGLELGQKLELSEQRSLAIVGIMSSEGS